MSTEIQDYSRGKSISIHKYDDAECSIQLPDEDGYVLSTISTTEFLSAVSREFGVFITPLPTCRCVR